MKLLELFSGNGDISKAFKSKGWDVYKVDWSEKVEADLHADVLTLSAEDLIKLCGGVPDVVWASPDCTTYSIATHRHRQAKTNFEPQTEYAKECDKVNNHLWGLIDDLTAQGTRTFFVENPRGRYRHMPFAQGRTRHTVTYCSYGRPSMKPTDIFTNHPDPMFKPECKPSTKVHAHAD